MDLGLGTLTELKRHLLNEALRDGTTYDTSLAAIGRGVAARFERVCDRRFGRQVGAVHECAGDRDVVLLDRYPVEAITAVALRESLSEGWVDQGAVDTVLENLAPASGLVTLPAPFSSLPGSRLRLTFTGGYWFAGRGAPQTISATVDLAAGTEEVPVVFSAAFGAWTPLVHCALVLPSTAATGVAVWPAAVTRLGFTAKLGAPVPAGCKLAYTAVGAAPGAGTARVQGGLIPLTAGAESATLAFAAAFAAAPHVQPVVYVPTAADPAVGVWPVAVTAAGCGFAFSAPIPGEGYALGWIATGGDVDDAEDGLQRAQVALTAAAETVAIAFPVVLESAPVLVCQVAAADGSALGIEAWPVSGTLDGEGATVSLSAPAPAGSVLHWQAMGGDVLPAGATPRPDDLFLAWLNQCQLVWSAIDALGLGLSDAKARAAAVDALRSLRLADDVADTLRAYVRYSL